MAEPERRRRRHRRRPAGEPGTAEAGTAEPGTAEPGTGEPGTAEPGTGEPGTGEPVGNAAGLAAEPAEPARAATVAAGPTVAAQRSRPRERSAGPADTSAVTEPEQAERGLRGLVGSGSSQVSIGAAMRARDAARPTDADLAAAERDLLIIRRHWVPREELPRGR